ncbi:hypothetical protein KCTC32516_01955 [Polaribacter huanghezhanensis]|uniref:hypothetical protein n=1 Tax=Polaribacter huanghezhanensis TaxID=1354726 RepID=UPI002648C229|nr:hypothetical protein [Polaribacter huanghezhanensis]WKD86579.1 hypothetical protein KCTC32516_01955 [Polaribacter huanghezhanensis]
MVSNSKNSEKRYSKIAIIYLFIAAALGITLRLFSVLKINATYKYIIHTHSHIALLGWVYVALITIIYHFGIDKEQKRKFSLIFWSTQITIVGMLFTFPFVGYALYSIIFSTLFLICTYWFYYFFKKNHILDIKSVSYKFIATSLLLMTISTIGPWAIGIIMNTLGPTSSWYKNAIYFYLHFQYNGWFIFCLIGIFYFLLEKSEIAFSKKLANQFYKLMLVSCILTLCLSFLWNNPPSIIYATAQLGAILQLIALGLFYKQVQAIKSKFKVLLKPLFYALLRFVFFLFLIKISLQALTSIPYFSELTTYVLDFVIGYLHLTFLGVVTLSTFVFLHYFKLINLPKIWIRIYILGFISSEVLIIYKGFSVWKQVYLIDHYFTYLVICSALMPIGILGILLKTSFTSSTQQESL